MNKSKEDAFSPSLVFYLCSLRERVNMCLERFNYTKKLGAGKL